MTYADMFSKVKGLFMESDVSDISEHLAFQFNITGEAEGIFYAEVKDGVLAVEPYEYFDRDAIFICSAETLSSWQMEGLIRFLHLRQASSRWREILIRHFA